MRFAKILVTAAAASMAIAPAMAASANPASGLSLVSAKSARVGKSVSKKSKLEGAGLIAVIVIGGGALIGGIIAATDGNNTPNSP